MFCADPSLWHLGLSKQLGVHIIITTNINYMGSAYHWRCALPSLNDYPELGPHAQRLVYGRLLNLGQIKQAMLRLSGQYQFYISGYATGSLAIPECLLLLGTLAVSIVCFSRHLSGDSTAFIYSVDDKVNCLATLVPLLLSIPCGTCLLAGNHGHSYEIIMIRKISTIYSYIRMAARSESNHDQSRTCLSLPKSLLIHITSPPLGLSLG